MEREEYFRLSGWHVEGSIPDEWIADMIRTAHIEPLWNLYQVSGVLFRVSARSCYRSVPHEISRGRSGKGAHTFPVGSLGAVDLLPPKGYTLAKAAELLRTVSQYQRIAIYPQNGFLHADYDLKTVHPLRTGYAQRYVSDSTTSPWRRVDTFGA